MPHAFGSAAARGREVIFERQKVQQARQAGARDAQAALRRSCAVEGVPGAHVAALRAHLQSALARSRLRHDTVFVEIFAGCANLSRHLRRLGFAVVSIDILYGPHCNLVFNDVYQELLEWIRSGRVWGLWLGTPCQGFTRARRAPPGSALPNRLRSNEQARGLSGLRPKDAAVLHLSKLLADRAGVLQRTARDHGVIGGEENPCSSFLGKFRTRETFLKHADVETFIVDYCACGTPWRARARLLLWGHQPEPSLLKLRCHGRGTCEFSKRPRLQRTGTSAGEFLTKKKNAYPDKFCRIVAKGLQ